MADIFKMPKLGETVTKGTVSRWLLAVGNSVNFDDPLLEISTDKVDSEIPSPYAGTLLEILVPEGETADVGAPLARIGLPAEAPVPSDPPAVAPAPPLAQSPSTSVGSKPLLSPVVRKLAAEHGVDLATVKGSGTHGRIMREDVEAAIAVASRNPRDERPRSPWRAATRGTRCGRCPGSGSPWPSG